MTPRAAPDRGSMTAPPATRTDTESVRFGWEPRGARFAHVGRTTPMAGRLSGGAVGGPPLRSPRRSPEFRMKATRRKQVDPEFDIRVRISRRRTLPASNMLGQARGESTVDSWPSQTERQCLRTHPDTKIRVYGRLRRIVEWWRRSMQPRPTRLSTRPIRRRFRAAPPAATGCWRSSTDARRGRMASASRRRASGRPASHRSP